jgi:hypothetical protein
MASPNTKRNSEADKNDLYITPVEALKEMGKIVRGTVLFDPCAGLGDMAEYFRENGRKVYTNELFNYGYKTDFNADFLDFRHLLNSNGGPYSQPDAIVMNPPYLLTMEFVNKAISLCRNVYMFNRLSVLESKSRAAKFKSKDWPLRKVWVFGFRVACDKGVNREPSANSVAYAIYHFDREYKGEPTIGWIT